MSGRRSAVGSRLSALALGVCKRPIRPDSQQEGGDKPLPYKEKRRAWVVRCIATAAVIAAALLTFPFEALPLGAPGIDSGWQWVVNTASQHGWVFGRDVVFTYGPLGWLATPQDVGRHLVLANAFRIALQALLTVCALWFLARYRRPIPILAFTLLWTVAGSVGLRFEGLVVLVVALMMVTSLKMGRNWPVAAAALIAGIVLFVKTSLGISTVTTIAIGAALIWKRRGFKAPAIAATVFVGTAGILTGVLFPSFSVVRTWISLALEVVDGYAAAASIIGPQLPLITGVILLLGCLGGAALISRRVPEFGLTAVILMPSLLITFRLAFVRQDGHQYLFVPFVIALLAIAALGAPRRVALGLCVTGLMTVVIGTTFGALPFGPSDLPKTLVFGHRGPANITRLLQMDHTRKTLAERSHANLEDLILPSEWTQMLQSTAHGMTVIPWELMYAPANNLPFQPLRSMQLYSAYTPVLDRLTAQGLSGPGAPDFVLDDFAPVGKRRALLDAPATWRALYLHYRLIRFDPDRSLLLLEHRPQPLPHTWRDQGKAALEIGGPGISVPASPHPVFAEIDASLNLFGRLNKSFFRVPLLMAVFHRPDGTASWARLIPATAPGGILVSHFPGTLEDYAGLWTRRHPVTVTRLQITGPGGQYYRSNADVRWRALVIE